MADKLTELPNDELHKQLFASMSPHPYRILRDGKLYDSGFKCFALTKQHAHTLAHQYKGDTFTITDNEGQPQYEVTVKVRPPVDVITLNHTARPA